MVGNCLTFRHLRLLVNDVNPVSCSTHLDWHLANLLAVFVEDMFDVIGDVGRRRRRSRCLTGSNNNAGASRGRPYKLGSDAGGGRWTLRTKEKFQSYLLCILCSNNFMTPTTVPYPGSIDLTLTYNLRHAGRWSVTLLLPCLGWLRHSHSRLLLLLVNHAHRLTVDPTNTLDKLKEQKNRFSKQASFWHKYSHESTT